MKGLLKRVTETGSLSVHFKNSPKCHSARAQRVKNLLHNQQRCVSEPEISRRGSARNDTFVERS